MTNEMLQTDADSTCADSVRWVSQLRDGELSASEKQRFEAHLSSCARCQVARKQFSTLFSGLDELLARPSIDSH